MSDSAILSLDSLSRLPEAFPSLGRQPGYRFRNVVHVVLKIDDSPSIFSAGNENRIRRGVELFLTLLKPSFEMDIYVKLSLLNGGDLGPFEPLLQHPLLTERNYRPRGETPLFIETEEMLKATLNASFHWQEREYQTYRIHALLTDGINEVHTPGRPQKTAEHVRRIIGPSLRRDPCRDIYVGLGVVANRKTRADVEETFRAMGIPERWIRMIDGLSIEDTFVDLAHTVTLASSSGADFTRTSSTGFGPAPDDPAKNPPAP